MKVLTKITKWLYIVAMFPITLVEVICEVTEDSRLEEVSRGDL